MPMRSILFTAPLLAVFLGLTPFPAFGEQPAKQPKPDVGRGKRIFTKYCAGCHGREGRGDGYRLLGPSPADLTGPAVKGRTDDELLRTIHEGKPNMPSWDIRLSQKDGRDVLAYVRTLSK